LSDALRSGERLADVTQRLRVAGSVFAEDEAQLLLDSVPDAELEAAVRRRTAGEPLEYILGWAEFCGLRIRVVPGVFVPRRRTEFLVQRAADLLTPHRHPLAIDICCGSGAIGAALAERTPSVSLFATDIDPRAVACARENIGDRGRVVTGDLFGGLPGVLRGRVDLIVANAPYVPTAEIALMPREARLHETRATFDGGADGLDLQRRISATAPGWLADGGHLLIETSERQAERTADIVARAGLEARIDFADDDGTTIVTGQATRPDRG
jgi:release factor glutamine methyltransferase